MNDLEYIASNTKRFAEMMEKRGLRFDPTSVIDLYKQKREQITTLNTLQAAKNDLAKSFSDPDVVRSKIIEKSKFIDSEIAKIKEAIQIVSERLDTILLNLPNILSEDVPPGKDESFNLQVRSSGVAKNFSFIPKSHDELGVSLGILDFINTSKISGARFSSLIGEGSKLVRVLKDFMLEHNRAYGYKEYFPPYLVKEEAMYRAGQLPKFSSESFAVDGGMRLIPTSEVTLLNFVSDNFFQAEELPIRMTAYSECFRSEAGSSGKDTKGMIRQHQFGKVELVGVTTPEESGEELERMVQIVEDLLQKLGIPYRVVLLCAGDIGFCARKTYDIEVWIPSQGCYREISSCSNCGDFQARRLSIKYKFGKRKGFLHTLNGSSLALGRTLVAILENYQRRDGSVEVPEVLQSMFGSEVIVASE
ncbi:serine--tRNA ligase [Neorickettsia helminthoeca str. Oregon]|uniref:Serine--tRNA ligase n=1 Tax=Neorickettsia helminthoeca str. Oregon TaxID=1286528 RepID=X5H4A0_9RICK|nr:serine--tRNA ligase [Neorickettsia helminthoeca]AHX11488.1 serine--tRNA ligase [Neorickettsia helminthoeca str. Oregon]